jgi:peptide/nickel transport system substrate-binding protein
MIMKGLPERKSFGILLLISLIFIGFAAFSPSSQAEQIITIAEGAAPETLDPSRTTMQVTWNIAGAICEPLAFLEFFPTEIKPNLATSWKALDDTTWEIELRKGIVFTNGEPFDANSVKFSIDRIKDPQLKSPTLGRIRPIKEVKVIDSHTVHIVTSGPTPNMPLYLTSIFIVPPKYVQEKGFVEFGKNPVGTGPFMLTKWVKDEYVELKANKDYWRGKAKLDRVIYKSIPENLSRMAALETREADLISNLLIEGIPSIENKKDLKIAKVTSLRSMFVQFNMLKESPLLDKRVRQAMNYAVDVDSIIKNVLQGVGEKLNGQVISSAYYGYNPNVKPYPHDPEKARQLIKEAGYENYEFTLLAPTGRYQKDKEVAETIGGQLNAAGIKTKVRIMEFGAYLERIQAKELFNMGFWGSSMLPVAEYAIGVLIREGQPYSLGKLPEVDKLYDEAVKTISEKRRLELFYKMAEICRDDPPFIFLYSQVNLYGVNSRVGGWKPLPDERIDLYSLYVK